MSEFQLEIDCYMLGGNKITALFLILTVTCHLFRNRLVIFNISRNSLADVASKAVSSINNKHMRIMKPY